jgi:5-methylcytosine-specific restriction endonuclease McrA
MPMKQDVLVLNANFEPINICDIKRAMGLMLTDKAILVANGRGSLYSVGRSYPIPSVIRLQHMVHRPKTRVCLSRKEIFRRDNFLCQYCGKTSSNLTIDHVIPKHLGGSTSWENLVTACPACNHYKGGRTIKEAKMMLVKPPLPPPQKAIYIFGRHIQTNQEWITFLEGW